MELANIAITEDDRYGIEDIANGLVDALKTDTSLSNAGISLEGLNSQQERILNDALLNALMDVGEEYNIMFEGKLSETNFGPEANPNQLASGLNPNREMEKEIVKRQERKEELMDMRVNMLRLMKSFKNLGFSEQEVRKYFEEEVKAKMKNTY